MHLEIARWIVRITLLYAALGALFALPFVFTGVNRIDPGARTANWRFRLLIVPGVVAFWPLLLRRWFLGQPPPTERNAHRKAAQVRP